MFDPLRLPQVSHLCYLGWVQVLLSRLDSISVFLILVIFCHGFIIGPFLGTFRFKLFADFSGLPQMLSVSSEDLSFLTFDWGAVLDITFAGFHLSLALIIT